jgi:hypothetical protein
LKEGILHSNGLSCLSTPVSKRVDQWTDGLRYILSVDGQTDGRDIVINRIHLDILYPTQLLLTGQVCPGVQVFSQHAKVFETAAVGCKLLSPGGGTVSIDFYTRSGNAPWYVVRQSNSMVVRTQYNHSGLTGSGSCPGSFGTEPKIVSCGLAKIELSL